MIVADELCMVYKIQKRHKGLRGHMQDFFHREYEEKKAVNQVSFSIQEGEIVGYIGPNGAGKSTTIKILTGILTPTSGTATVCGLTPYEQRRENAWSIGVVFGQRSQLWWDIPISDTLNLLKHMYRIPEDVYQKNIALFNEILELHTFKNSAVRQLSLGQRMRADFACALLHDPKVLYLDEPTIGLDVVVKEKVREFIREINRLKKTTIILTTHDMFDVEKLCRRIMVIDKGCVIYDGQLEELRRQYGSDGMMVFETLGGTVSEETLLSLGAKRVLQEQNRITITYHKETANMMGLIDELRKTCEITNLQVLESNVDEIIRKMYEAI